MHKEKIKAGHIACWKKKKTCVVPVLDANT